MKWLVNLLILAATASADHASEVKQFALDPMVVVRIPVSRDRLTSVRFPSAIADLEGAFVSSEPEPPALFQISFRPGNAFFAVRALGTNVTVNLLVGWKGQTYALECFEAADSAVAVILAEKTPQTTNSAPRRPTPIRLKAILKTAALLPYIVDKQPELLRDLERVIPNRTVALPDCDVVLDEVLRFGTDDTLVFRVTFRNKTSSPILYRPTGLGVAVGNKQFSQSAVEADGVVPPCGQASASFSISAGVHGTPPGVSVQKRVQRNLRTYWAGLQCTVPKHLSKLRLALTFPST